MIFQHKIKHLVLSNSTAKTAVKTGDNTPILPFVIILLAAIVAIVVFVKKRFGSKKN